MEILLDEAGDWVTERLGKDQGTPWYLCVGLFFLRLALKSPDSPGPVGKLSVEGLLLMQEDQIKECWSRLDPERMYPPNAERAVQCHCEATPDYIWMGVTTREDSWVLDWKEVPLLPINRKGGVSEIVQSCLEKMMEKTILGTISDTWKDKKVIGNRQHAILTQGKLCLNISFYNQMTEWVDEGRATEIVYLDFSPVSYDIKIDKPVEYGLGKWHMWDCKLTELLGWNHWDHLS